MAGTPPPAPAPVTQPPPPSAMFVGTPGGLAPGGFRGTPGEKPTSPPPGGTGTQSGGSTSVPSLPYGGGATDLAPVPDEGIGWGKVALWAGVGIVSLWGLSRIFGGRSSSSST